MNLKDAVKEGIAGIRAALGGLDKAEQNVAELLGAREEAQRDIIAVEGDDSLPRHEAAKITRPKKDILDIVAARLPRAQAAAAAAGEAICTAIRGLAESLQTCVREESDQETALGMKTLARWARYESQCKRALFDLTLLKTIGTLTTTDAVLNRMYVQRDNPRNSGQRAIKFGEDLQAAGSFLELIRHELAGVDWNGKSA